MTGWISFFKEGKTLALAFQPWVLTLSFDPSFKIERTGLLRKKHWTKHESMQARKLASMKPNITFIFGLKAPLCNLGHYHHFVMNLILEFDLWEWGEGRQNKYFFKAKKNPGILVKNRRNHVSERRRATQLESEIAAKMNIRQWRVVFMLIFLRNILKHLENLLLS